LKKTTITIAPNSDAGNSIVAAYSFVTRNIPKNQIWAGIPASFKEKLSSEN